MERLSGLAHLDPEPVRNRPRPRCHHLPQSSATGTDANTANARLYLLTPHIFLLLQNPTLDPMPVLPSGSVPPCLFSSAVCSVCVSAAGRRSPAFLWNTWSSCTSNMSPGFSTGRSGSATEHAHNAAFHLLEGVQAMPSRSR